MQTTTQFRRKSGFWKHFRAHDRSDQRPALPVLVRALADPQDRTAPAHGLAHHQEVSGGAGTGTCPAAARKQARSRIDPVAAGQAYCVIPRSSQNRFTVSPLRSCSASRSRHCSLFVVVLSSTPSVMTQRCGACRPPGKRGSSDAYSLPNTHDDSLRALRSMQFFGCK